MSELPTEILRRLQFVLDVAKSEPKSSQDLKMVMRVLSNIASVGRDGGSGVIYKLNRLVSEKALRALEACDEFDQWVGNEKKGFKRQVMNEHQMPLEEMVAIIRSSETFGVSDIWHLLTSHPMVTLLVDEDDLLSKVSKKESNPERRYGMANIEVVKLPVGAYEYWYHRNSMASKNCM